MSAIRRRRPRIAERAVRRVELQMDNVDAPHRLKESRLVAVVVEQNEDEEWREVVALTLRFGGASETFVVQSSETIRTMGRLLLAAADRGETIGLFDAANAQAALRALCPPTQQSRGEAR